jgi:RNA polymerase-binding transcription factor DksA
MPAALSQQKTRELEQILTLRSRELRSVVQQEWTEPDDNRHADLTSRGHENQEAPVVDISMAVTDLHINEIHGIEAALVRIAAGTYGTCVGCEEDIGYDRLRAYPTAMRCRDCQGKVERKYC